MAGDAADYDMGTLSGKVKVAQIKVGLANSAGCDASDIDVGSVGRRRRRLASPRQLQASSLTVSYTVNSAVDVSAVFSHAGFSDTLKSAIESAGSDLDAIRAATGDASITASAVSAHAQLVLPAIAAAAPTYKTTIAYKLSSTKSIDAAVVASAVDPTSVGDEPPLSVL